MKLKDYMEELQQDDDVRRVDVMAIRQLPQGSQEVCIAQEVYRPSDTVARYREYHAHVGMDGSVFLTEAFGYTISFLH